MELRVRRVGAKIDPPASGRTYAEHGKRDSYFKSKYVNSNEQNCFKSKYRPTQTKLKTRQILEFKAKPLNG